MITYVSIAYNIIGLIALGWATKAYFGTTQTEPVKLPFFGDLAYSEIIIFSIPVLCALLAINLLLLQTYRRHTRAKSKWSGFPNVPLPRTKQLIPQKLSWLKAVFFCLFIFVPGATLVRLVERVPTNLYIYDLHHPNHRLEGTDLFQFPTEPLFLNGKRWRWYEPTGEDDKTGNRATRISAYPGLQPLGYITIVIIVLVWSVISFGESWKHPPTKRMDSNG